MNTKYIISNIDENERKSAFVYEFIGYNEDTHTCERVERGYKKMSEITNNLSINNNFGIDIRYVRLYNDKKYTARIFSIPRRNVVECISDYDVNYGDFTEIIKCSDGSVYGISTLLCRVEVLRLFLLEHYAKDGYELFWYDRRGNKCSTQSHNYKIYFANEFQAQECKKYKSIYDGCCSVVTMYTDPRFFADIYTELN